MRAASLRGFAEVAAQVKIDLAKHQITPVSRNGIHGHWMCRRPETGIYGFSIVTWPGYLTFVGDMGDYVFARTSNMIAFMRRASQDPGYMSEKCVASCADGITEWSEDEFRAVLREARKRGKEAKEKASAIWTEYEIYDSPHDAARAMHESGLWDEVPCCHVYTRRFLWCLHAIEWFGSRVDETNFPYEG